MSDLKLKKEIGLFEAMAIVVGMVIGSGIFFKPSIVFQNAGSPVLGILAWTIGGIITIAAGLTIAEIGTLIPRVGGLYAYLKEIYGEKVAFLLGWVQTLLYYPGSIAALAIVFATQASVLVPMNAWQQKTLAVVMIVSLTLASIISTKLSGKIQGVATVAKLIPIVVIAGFGLINGNSAEFTPYVGETSNIAGFGAAILGTLWAYDGWSNVANMSGEMKNPSKNLPKAIIYGLLAVVIVYVVINISIIMVMPIGEAIASKTIASDVAVKLLGQGGAMFITCGILISIFGALNGYTLTGPRVSFAMGEEKILPFSNFFGKLSENGTPKNALIAQCIISIALALSGSFEILTNLAMFVMWIFFTMTVFGVFILRKRMKDVERPYKVPLYPVVPLIGVIGGGYIVINTIFTQTMFAVLGLLITAAGIPVYIYEEKKR